MSSKFRLPRFYIDVSLIDNNHTLNYKRFKTSKFSQMKSFAKNMKLIYWFNCVVRLIENHVWTFVCSTAQWFCISCEKMKNKKQKNKSNQFAILRDELCVVCVWIKFMHQFNFDWIDKCETLFEHINIANPKIE